MLYQLGDEVVSRMVGGETVLVDLNSETYFGLNRVGSQIWTGLEARRSLDEIVAAIVDQFEVSAEQAAADASLLLKELERAGLVHRVG